MQLYNLMLAAADATGGGATGQGAIGHSAQNSETEQATPADTRPAPDTNDDERSEAGVAGGAVSAVRSAGSGARDGASPGVAATSDPGL